MAVPNSRILSGIRKLHDGRDGWRELIKVVNSLIDTVAAIVAAGGPSALGAKLSFDLGLDILSQAGGGPEVVVWQRPIPYGIFSPTATSISVYLDVVGARVELGTPGTFSLRLGGTDRFPDGTVIATTSVAYSVDPGYAPLTMSASIPILSGQDLLKLTITPGSGDAKIKEGGVTLS